MQSVNSLLLAAVMMVGYVLAYRIYGRFLARKIFRLDPNAPCPSQTFRDDIDFVPTHKHILFGHHFTSIAGLGPIVGPAIAVIWGWLPAVLWVFFGSIFMGAVHDFGALVVSLRHQGRSIGAIAADVVNPRVRLLFLLIIFFLLLLVIAVFALIIALLFNMYPAAVIPVWLEIPIALVLGWWVYKKSGSALWASLIAVAVMYITVMIGAYYPINVEKLLFSNSADPSQFAVIFWIVMVLIFNSWLASSLPVQMLLQPRDFINSHQLMIAMALLGLAVIVAHPPLVAPVVNTNPQGAPAMLPFLFVVLACGAISGFHSLVSSGTSGKQCHCEPDAAYIGYGGMMWEAALAALVIVAVAGGIGMGLEGADGELLTGVAAFNHHYSSWQAASGLSAKLGAFVNGSANMMGAYGMPEHIAMAIMAVFIVSFAGTTVDSATRIQRYVVTEIGRAVPPCSFLTNRQVATLVAVVTATALAFSSPDGKGALTLWPLFGSLNQLLAALALMIVTIYLARKRIPVIFTGLPCLFMLAMTAWAMTRTIGDFYKKGNTLLLVIGLIVVILEVWMVVESALVIRNLKRTPAPQT